MKTISRVVNINTPYTPQSLFDVLKKYEGSVNTDYTRESIVSEVYSYLRSLYIDNANISYPITVHIDNKKIIHIANEKALVNFFKTGDTGVDEYTDEDQIPSSMYKGEKKEDKTNNDSTSEKRRDYAFCIQSSKPFDEKIEIIFTRELLTEEEADYIANLTHTIKYKIQPKTS